MKPEPLVVMTTCANDEAAARLADKLVDARLAACVNRMGPVTSTYRWQERIEHDEEYLLFIKTDQTRYAALEQTIRDHSNHDIPEIIALPITAGLPAYLGWLNDAVKIPA